MTRSMTRLGISVFAVMILALAAGASDAKAAITITIPDNYPTIQQGIDAAVNGDTVLVRDGTYKLTAPLDFKGKAITVAAQNMGASILDGQNQTRVVYFHTGEGSGSVLDGFTIRNGYVIGGYGAGIYLSGSSPTIKNCTINTNTVYNCNNASMGGAIYSEASSPTISHCTISGNHAQQGCGGYALGGGIYINGGVPIIDHSAVLGNIASGPASYGGGIYGSGSSPSINNSTISNNSTSGTDLRGGGVYLSNSTPSIVNSIISGNSAVNGAGIYFEASSAFSKITNSTFVRNTASGNGGALYCNNTSPQIINSILWEDSPQEVYKSGTGNPTITYSDVYDGYSGTGNINVSPSFVSISAQDYHLRPGSPCINVGNNSASELPLQDKDGNARINDGTVDLGAYEYFSTILLLNNNRFKVEVSWSVVGSGSGHGVAVPLTNDSGYFWFFGSSNVELLAKVLDGRGTNGHYWFFWGAMTDVQYDITVTDTEAQPPIVKHYYGTQGVQRSGNDVNAF